MSLFLLLLPVQAAEIQIQLIDKKGRGVSQAFVELIAKDGTRRATPSTAIIDQVDKEFVPLISAIPQGSTVSFPNSDNIQHQIYSFSKAKKFDLPLLAKNESKKITFDKSGIVSLGCNIHDWMLSYIYIFESEFVVQSNDKGTSAFTDIPHGEYSLRIWSPRMKSTSNFISQEITVQEGNNPIITQELNVRKKIRKKPRLEDGEY